jgi:hypothetical protein
MCAAWTVPVTTTCAPVSTAWGTAAVTPRVRLAEADAGTSVNEMTAAAASRIPRALIIYPL